MLLVASCASVDRPPAGAGPTAPPEGPRELSGSPDEVGSQVEEADREFEAIYEGGLPRRMHDLWDGWNRTLEKATRVRLGMNYTAVFQRASATAMGPSGAAGGDFDFFGRWQVRDEAEPWPGAIKFQTELRHRYTGISPAELGTGAGSLLGTTSSFNDQKLSLVQLYWDHGSFQDRLRYRVGKLAPANIYDAGRYVSDNYAFLGQAFSDTAPMALPGAGLGLATAVYPGGEWYAVAGLHDANGRPEAAGFDSLGQGEFFAALEIGCQPGHGEVGAGAYHVTVWHVDARERAGVPSGRGFAMTLEQEFGSEGEFVPFLRYAYGEGAGLRVRQLLATGLGIEGVLGQSNDLVGIGLAWARPSDRTLRDQYVIEIFYRFQLTPHTHVTPGVQLLLDPSYAPDENAVWVLGLRLRTLF